MHTQPSVYTSVFLEYTTMQIIWLFLQKETIPIFNLSYLLLFYQANFLL